MKWISSPKFCKELNAIKPHFYGILLNALRALQASFNPIINRPASQQFLSTELRIYQGIKYEQHELDIRNLIVTCYLLELNSKQLCDVEPGEL